MINAQKAIESTVNTTSKIANNIGTQASRTIGSAAKAGQNITSAGIKIAGNLAHQGARSARSIGRASSRALNTTIIAGGNLVSGIANQTEKTIHSIGETSSKLWDRSKDGLSAASLIAGQTWGSAKTSAISFTGKAAQTTSDVFLEGARRAGVAMESTFVAGLVAYDHARRFTESATQFTKTNAAAAWDYSKTTATELTALAKEKGSQAIQFTSEHASAAWQKTAAKTTELSTKAKVHGGHALEVTTKTATQAWESSKAAAKDMSWEKVQVQSGKAVEKMNARIAHEMLASARKSANLVKFAAILTKQDGEENFANLLNEEDVQFLADAYADAIRNHEKLGSDYSASLLKAAKPYPAFVDALANAVNNQLDAAYRLNNQGRSAETRSAYRSLSLMFNQATDNPDYLAKIEPEKLKRVHAAGKSMGYTNESSEILLFARKASPSLVSAFCPQDIAGAVRTQKKELGVTELPQDMLLG